MTALYGPLDVLRERAQARGGPAYRPEPFVSIEDALDPVLDRYSTCLGAIHPMRAHFTDWVDKKRCNRCGGRLTPVGSTDYRTAVSEEFPR